VSTAVVSDMTEASHCEKLESTRTMPSCSHSTSLVLERLIGALVAVEAVVKPASLVVGDDEYGIGQLKSDLLEVER
jgi:hypothetical protein